MNYNYSKTQITNEKLIAYNRPTRSKFLDNSALIFGMHFGIKYHVFGISTDSWVNAQLIRGKCLEYKITGPLVLRPPWLANLLQRWRRKVKISCAELSSLSYLNDLSFIKHLNLMNLNLMNLFRFLASTSFWCSTKIFQPVNYIDW